MIYLFNMPLEHVDQIDVPPIQSSSFKQIIYFKKVQKFAKIYVSRGCNIVTYINIIKPVLTYFFLATLFEKQQNMKIVFVIIYKLENRSNML